MHDLSLHLLELLENSVRAGACTIAVELSLSRASDLLTMTVEDDGPGFPTAPGQTLDPFFTTKPGKRTGLGLSLLHTDAVQADGELVLGRSPRLGGALVQARLHWSHVDRPPLGDLEATLVIMAATNPGVTFSVGGTVDGRRRTFTAPRFAGLNRVFPELTVLASDPTPENLAPTPEEPVPLETRSTT